MPAVGHHGVLPLGDAAQEGKADVKDRHAENKKRHREGDDRVELEQARDRERRQNIAKERRAGVAHENLGWIHVVGNKAEAGAEKCRQNDRNIHFGDKKRNHHQRSRGNGRDADGEAVETIDKIDGVRDRHDPDDRDRDRQPAEIPVGRAAEHVGIGQKLDDAAVIDRHSGRRNLHKQLRQRLERHDIIQHAQNHDHDGAEQNALHRAVDLGENQDRKQKREKDCEAAQARNRHLVHPPVVFRDIDGSHFIGKGFDHRCGKKRHDRRDPHRQQHIDSCPGIHGIPPVSGLRSPPFYKLCAAFYRRDTRRARRRPCRCSRDTPCRSEDARSAPGWGARAPPRPRPRRA